MSAIIFKRSSFFALFITAINTICLTGLQMVDVEYDPLEKCLESSPILLIAAFPGAILGFFKNVHGSTFFIVPWLILLSLFLGFAFASLIGKLFEKLKFYDKKVRRVYILLACCYAYFMIVRNPVMLNHTVEVGNERGTWLMRVLGANLNAKDCLDRNPLHIAVKNGDAQMLNFLLSQGTDIFLKGEYDRSLLQTAVIYSRVDIVNFLIAHKLDINYRDANKDLPITLAVEHPSLPVLETLLKNGADIDARNWHGSSAIMLAAWGGKTDLVKFLLDHHPNLSFKEDFSGLTALGLAQRASGVGADRAEIIKVLQRAGAP